MVVAYDSCWSSARANGLNLVEPNEDFSTVVTCKDTTARLEKTSCRTGVKKESPVTEGDRSQLGSVVGGLAWVARQARPDLSYKVPKLQSWCNNANYQRLSKATSGPWTGIQIRCSRLEEHDACHGTWCIMEQWDRTPQGKQQKHRGQRARRTILASPDFRENKTQVSTYIVGNQL